jgi:hypothetical protein
MRILVEEEVLEVYLPAQRPQFLLTSILDWKVQSTHIYRLKDLVAELM